MEKELKIKLTLYGLISAFCFSYLILPEKSSVGVFVFAIIQLLFLYFIVPERKKLVWYMPVIIFSINSFISTNGMWNFSNIVLTAIMYSCMFTKFDIKDISLDYFYKISCGLFEPIKHFNVPFKWAMNKGGEKATIIKKIIIALVIALPCSTALIGILSSADMIFSIKTQYLFENIASVFNGNTLFKTVLGCIVGLYLFAILYRAYNLKEHIINKKNNKDGDLLIINIVLTCLLLVYSVFIIIQFKYLFAGAKLPDGLTYTQYARKGFFELLILSTINIIVIVGVTLLTHKKHGKGFAFSKILCCYMCMISIILLISSFYRMILYTNSDGFTRLRFMVMGFLIFEAIGLFITFAFIINPKFNVIMIYGILALTYYCILNVVPMDSIIAKNQIDLYLNNQRHDIYYVFDLSLDISKQMEYFYNNTDDEDLKSQIKGFLMAETYTDIPERWQRYNISYERGKSVLKSLEN